MEHRSPEPESESAMFHQPLTLRRLFFALRPPLPLARRIAAAAGWFDDNRQAIAADRLHMTLFILDDMVRVPPGLIALLRDVGAGIESAPVAVTLDVASGSDRSIALRPARRNAALADLRETVATRARSCGVAEREGYRFAPHLTLGYRDGAPFSKAVAPVAWAADEIVLIESHVGRTRHDILGRWPLRGAGEAQLPLL